MNIYEAIILNPEVNTSWSFFLRNISENDFSIEESNILFERQVTTWINEEAEKRCPPPKNEHLEKVKDVLRNHFHPSS